MRYRDQNGQRWADIIDFLTMCPDARRRVVRLLGEIRSFLGPGRREGLTSRHSMRPRLGRTRPAKKGRPRVDGGGESLGDESLADRPHPRSLRAPGAHVLIDRARRCVTAFVRITPIVLR
jgi:hypothetical protein